MNVQMINSALFCKKIRRFLKSYRWQFYFYVNSNEFCFLLTFPEKRKQAPHFSDLFILSFGASRENVGLPEAVWSTGAPRFPAFAAWGVPSMQEARRCQNYILARNKKSARTSE